jgi:hypothetical protein
VFGVIRRSFRQLTLLALVPAVLLAVYNVALSAAMPNQAELGQLLKERELTPSGAGDQFAILGLMFGRAIPVVLVFVVLATVVNAFVYMASLFIAVRDADGQPSTAAEGLRFARSVALPAIGWGVLAWVVVTIGYFLFFIPGLYLNVVLFSSLAGVVAIERAGISRCFQLIKDRFWATFGRLAIAALIMIAYFVALMVVLLLVGGLLGLAFTALGGAGGTPSPGGPSFGFVAVVAVVQAALLVPLSLFTVAVATVTYAELRFRENPSTSTATLARELAR